MTDVQAPWRLVPRLLLRRAGFGFDLLDALTDPAVAGAAARYRAAVTELETIRGELLARTFPAAVTACRDRADRAALRALSKARTAIGRRQQVPAAVGTACPAYVCMSGYQTACDALQAAETELAAAVVQDLADRPARLRKVADPSVLDAMLQLAPSFYDGAVRWLADGASAARERAMMRRMYLYLQRLAAKNETTSFFGPLVHGTVDPVAGDTVAGDTVAGGEAIDDVRFGPAADSGVIETKAFMAFWAVCALARRMAADPPIHPVIPVTRVPACRIDGGVLTLADGRTIRLTADQERLLAAVDGYRSAAAVAEAAGLPHGQSGNWLARFERLGVVRTWPEPASTAIQPFEQLRADASAFGAGTGWPQRLTALESRMREYAGADGHERRRAALAALEAEFTQLSGVDPRRAGGKMYADRLVAFIEAHGGLSPVRLGSGLAALIERQLTPVLDVGARHGELLHQAHQSLAMAVLREAGVPHMPYDEFIRRIGRAAEAGALREYLGPAEEFEAALAALVLSRTSGESCTLDPSDLLPFGGSRRAPGFASPDLLIRRAEGGPVLVLGEVHPYVFAWGSQELFCPDPEGLRESFAANLSPWGGPAALATVVRRRRHKGLVTESFPGRFVEVTAVATRVRERTVPITGLFVEATEDRVALRGADGELVLYAGEDDHSHLLAFAPPPVRRFPPVWLGDRAPRITVGALVAQRAAWRLRPAELAGVGTTSAADGAACFSATQRTRALSGLPRWVYAHVPGEPKPLCVDLDSPLAVEALASVIRVGVPGPVTVQEMLPEPEALWLRCEGRPVTSELRLAMIRSER
jgi:hypothetical protein